MRVAVAVLYMVVERQELVAQAVVAMDRVVVMAHQEQLIQAVEAVVHQLVTQVVLAALVL
jgi:hypothetical protein